MHYSKQQKIDAFRKLPPEFQDIIMSEETVHTLEALDREYNLSPEEGSILSKEVTLILLRLEPQENLIQRLTQSLKREREQITVLANKVAGKLFEATRLETPHPSQPDNVPQQQPKKPEHFVHGGWKPDHTPNIQSVERPISSSLIKKQVEKRQQNEGEDERREVPKPKPYWPDPYREPLGDE